MEMYTTDFVAGRDPVQYYGTAHGIGFSHEGQIAHAINMAHEQLEKTVQGWGGNAVLGLRYENAVYGKTLMVHVYATAVRF